MYTFKDTDRVEVDDMAHFTVLGPRPADTTLNFFKRDETTRPYYCHLAIDLESGWVQPFNWKHFREQALSQPSETQKQWNVIKELAKQTTRPKKRKHAEDPSNTADSELEEGQVADALILATGGSSKRFRSGKTAISGHSASRTLCLFGI